MMNHEERSNDKFRQKLQEQWMEEARSAVGPVPVDADKLWQRIDRGLIQEKPVPQSLQLSPRYWAMLGAAALAFLLVMSRSFFEEPSSHSVQMTLTPLPDDSSETLETLVSTHREPLQTPSRWDAPRCDQTKQSCLFVAFL